MDAVTYPSADVQPLLAEHFVALRLVLNRSEDRAHFRAYRVLWTPTIAILDRRGADHHQSPGFLPPESFAHMLRIGLGRALTAWSRYGEAAAQLGAVADAAGSPLAPEALFWLGVTRYLETRKRDELMAVWRRLRAEYPTSIWALRIPPNQEQEPE